MNCPSRAGNKAPLETRPHRPGPRRHTGPGRGGLALPQAWGEGQPRGATERGNREGQPRGATERGNLCCRDLYPLWQELCAAAERLPQKPQTIKGFFEKGFFEQVGYLFEQVAYL